MDIIGRNPSMMIPLLAKQDLTPMLEGACSLYPSSHVYGCILLATYLDIVDRETGRLLHHCDGVI